MTDRPILFSAPMIRALLDGRKTQTRRVLKLPTKTSSGGAHYERPDMGGWGPAVHGGGGCFTFGRDGQKHPVPEMVGMYHGTCGTSIVAPIQRGDRLWVREAWNIFDISRDGEESWPLKEIPKEPPDDEYGPWCLDYPVLTPGKGYDSGKGPWRPSIHMPRWASRITLYVTDVRVQRLQDISEADAVAEGATSRPNCSGFMGRDDGWSMDWSRVGEMSFYASRPPGSQEKAPLQESDLSLCDPQMAFASYWNDINGPDAWELNPWVAAYTFEVWQGNIDCLPAEIGGSA